MDGREKLEHGLRKFVTIPDMTEDITCLMVYRFGTVSTLFAEVFTFSPYLSEGIVHRSELLGVIFVSCRIEQWDAIVGPESR